MQVSLGVHGQSAVPTALTIGNFDGLHQGHHAMLKRLITVARADNMPACVLTFEPHPREFFTPQQAPARLTNLREKLSLLQAAGIENAREIIAATLALTELGSLRAWTDLWP